MNNATGDLIMTSTREIDKVGDQAARMAEWQRVVDEGGPQTTVDGHTITLLARTRAPRSFAVIDVLTGTAPPADTKPDRMSNYITF